MSPTTASIDICTVRDYLDWHYATTGGHKTFEFHRQLVRDQRPCPTLEEAREAMTRIVALGLALEMR